VPTFNLAYNGFNSELEVPVKDYLWFSEKFGPYATDNIDWYIDTLSNKVSTHPTLCKDTVIILNGLDFSTDENSTWIKKLNQFAVNQSHTVILLTGKLTDVSVDYWIDPTLGPDVWPELEFNLVRLDQFIHFANLIYDYNVKKTGRDPVKDIDYPRDKKLYWASTKDIYWRRYILKELLPYLDESLINYKCLDSCIPGDQVTQRVFDPELINHIHSECYSINDRVPLPYLDDEIQFEKTDITFHLRCFMGLVIETFYESSTVFFSEKLYNIIAYKQIFFYVGGYKSIEHLRNQGYYVFDNVFDLSYDSINNPGERIVAARKSFMSVMSKPIEEIKQIYNNHKTQIEHNFKLFKQDDFLDKFTSKIKECI
jgi:hypothetical protein